MRLRLFVRIAFSCVAAWSLIACQWFEQRRQLSYELGTVYTDNKWTPSASAGREDQAFITLRTRDGVARYEATYTFCLPVAGNFTRIFKWIKKDYGLIHFENSWSVYPGGATAESFS